jgi:hypothetical protein
MDNSGLEEPVYSAPEITFGDANVISESDDADLFSSSLPRSSADNIQIGLSFVIVLVIALIILQVMGGEFSTKNWACVLFGSMAATYLLDTYGYIRNSGIPRSLGVF